VKGRASCVVRRASVMTSAAVLFCAAAPLRPCAAQSDPRLVAAVRLAQEGQGDSARVQVKRILDATPVANPLYAEALYASGLVAGNATEMERQFRRLVVEYNGSAWSDDALLKLMQLNFAQGDLPGVTRTAERLAVDYPQSEVIPEAARWAARAYFRQSDNNNGCRWLADGLARADTTNVELRNGLVFLSGRCGAATDTAQGRGGAVAQNSTPTPLQDTTPTQSVVPSPQSAFTIQVAVASSRPNAEALVRKLTQEGLPGGRIFAEGGAFKVRLGRPNADRPAVEVQLLEVRKKYPSAFVVEERP
jgi:sporulation related protein